jgi:hypothetical protein
VLFFSSEPQPWPHSGVGSCEEATIQGSYIRITVAE